MDAALPALFEFEVFDRVRNIDLAPVDGGIAKRTVEQLARRSDKRVPLQVFFVSRLLANHENFGFGRPFAEDGLRGMEIEIAAVASLHALLQDGQSLLLRNPWECCSHRQVLSTLWTEACRVEA